MNEIDRVEVSDFIVPWRDIGPSGEMQASAYLVQAEAALRQFWRFRPSLEDEPRYGATKFEVRIHAALKEGERVLMTVHVDKIGGKSVGFEVAMEKDGQTVAEVDITWTARETETGEPAALPEDIRDWLYRYVP